MLPAPVGWLIGSSQGRQLGHATTTITRDLYQHVRRAVHGDAAEKVVALLPARKASDRTGS